MDACAFHSSGSRGGSTTRALTVFSADEVSLEWDANAATDLAEYRMYIGTSSREYGEPIDVGLASTYTVTGLLVGHTSCLAVTACNTAGQESEKSNEVVCAAP